MSSSLRPRCFSPLKSSSPEDEDPRRFVLQEDGSGDDYPRNNLGRELRGLQSAGLKKQMEPGDTVVCTREVASAGIYENRGYELQSIYAQRFNPQTQKMEKLSLASLDQHEIPPGKGYTRYVTLYSPVYHKEPVVVTPEEVGLVSVRSTVVDSIRLAIPGAFWVYVCFVFYGIYHERTGGSFVDAFWGR